MKFFSRVFAGVMLLLCFPLFLVSCGDKADLSEYEIEVEYSGNELNGKETVSFYNCYDTSFKELKFNLFANAFRIGAKHSPVAAQYRSEAYYNGESYGGIEIISVSENGESAEFDICGEDENILIVKLKDEVFPNERAKVTIEFKVTLAKVVSRTGINENAVNLANFYPILCAVDENGFYECVYYPIGDPFFSECANYKVTVRYDENLSVAASGYPIESTVTDGKKTETYKIENARSFAIALSDSYEVISKEVGETRVNYYYYNDDEPEIFLDYAVKAMTLFNELFGKYPYKSFSVAKTGFIQGGMEFPGLVYISDELEKKAFGEVIVHETAHQWWQTVVGNNEIEYGFLDEGLAEYSVVLFYEKYSEYGYTRENLIASSEKTYKTFCSVHDKLFGEVNTVMLRSLKDFKSEYEYVNTAYVKPCIMYDTLRLSIGEEKFFKGLKNYYGEYAFKNAVPDDLKGVYERLNADTNGFFDGFFTGKVIL